jgi:hypothetical protein
MFNHALPKQSMAESPSAFTPNASVSCGIITLGAEHSAYC